MYIINWVILMFSVVLNYFINYIIIIYLGTIEEAKGIERTVTEEIEISGRGMIS